jgi:hypothetical protein
MEYKLQLEVTSNTKVVVMDDDPIFCAQISNLLLLEGFQVNSFNDGGFKSEVQHLQIP